MCRGLRIASRGPTRPDRDAIHKIGVCVSTRDVVIEVIFSSMDMACRRIQTIATTVVDRIGLVIVAVEKHSATLQTKRRGLGRWLSSGDMPSASRCCLYHHLVVPMQPPKGKAGWAVGTWSVPSAWLTIKLVLVGCDQCMATATSSTTTRTARSSSGRTRGIDRTRRRGPSHRCKRGPPPCL